MYVTGPDDECEVRMSDLIRERKCDNDEWMDDPLSDDIQETDYDGDGI